MSGVGVTVLEVSGEVSVLSVRGGRLHSFPVTNQEVTNVRGVYAHCGSMCKLSRVSVSGMMCGVEVSSGAECNMKACTVKDTLK